MMILGIIGNTNKPQVSKVVGDFVSLLEKENIRHVYTRDMVDFLDLGPDDPVVDAKDIGASCDIVVAFGGDGTILSTANIIGNSGVPILGVNSGGLGFLAEVLVEEIPEAIHDLQNKNYNIIDRMLFNVDVVKQDGIQHFTALNDVVIDKGKEPRLISIEVKVDDTFLNTYRSDGLIISTPTGSTAYSLSAGGPLIMPTMNAFIVTPICPHSLTVRPIVLSCHSVLKVAIKPGQEPVQINIDGQSILSLRENEYLEIKQSDFALKWVSIGKRDFFEILRTKLNWGVDNTAFMNAKKEPCP